MPWIECPTCTAHVSLVMVPSEHSGYFVSDRDIEAWTDCCVPPDLWEWLRVRRGEGHCIVRGYRCPQCGRLWADGDDALARSTPGYGVTTLPVGGPDLVPDADSPTVRHVLPGDFYYAPVEGGVHRTRVEEAGYVIRVGEGEAFVSEVNRRQAQVDAERARAEASRAAQQVEILAEVATYPKAELEAVAAQLAEGFKRADGSTYGSPTNGDLEHELEDNGR